MLHKYLDPLMDNGAMVADLLDPMGKRPPDEPGVYFVSDLMAPIYVGQTVSLAGRIGELLAAMLGYSVKGGRLSHSGGKTIRKDEDLRRRTTMLEIQWLANPPCLDCAEYEIWNETRPSANTAAVTVCETHDPPLKLSGGKDK